MKSIHVLEKVKLSDGKIDIVYNCYSKKLESGINGEVCVHVALLYMVEGIPWWMRQRNPGTIRKHLIYDIYDI